MKTLWYDGHHTNLIYHYLMAYIAYMASYRRIAYVVYR